MTGLLSARVESLISFLQSGHFRPAAVQRDFQWDEFRAERLLREITEAMRSVTARGSRSAANEGRPSGLEDDEKIASEETEVPGLAKRMPEAEAAAPNAMPGFYIGVIVISAVDRNVYAIFDGLQRLTTLTILVSVLRDLIDDPDVKKRLHSAVATNKGDFRLCHAGTDTTLATMIQSLGEAGKRRQNRSRPANESARHIFDVGRRFVVVLQRREQDELMALAKFLLDLVFVGIVETNDQRLARHIFVATNLYGLPLRRDEVFKGQILALAADALGAANLESTWNAVRDTVGQPALEEFLVAFDLIWRRQPQGADCLGDLIDHLARPENKGTLTPFMDSLREYATAWKAISRLQMVGRLAITSGDWASSSGRSGSLWRCIGSSVT